MEIDWYVKIGEYYYMKTTSEDIMLEHIQKIMSIFDESWNKHYDQPNIVAYSESYYPENDDFPYNEIFVTKVIYLDRFSTEPKFGYVIEIVPTYYEDRENDIKRIFEELKNKHGDLIVIAQVHGQSDNLLLVPNENKLINNSLLNLFAYSKDIDRNIFARGYKLEELEVKTFSILSYVYD